MIKTKYFNRILLTGVSLLSILIPVLIWGLWIHSYYSSDSYEDRLNMYLQYFPEGLRGQYTLSLLAIVLCSMGIVLSTINLNEATTLHRAVSVVIMVCGGLILMLTLFTLLFPRIS